jgi:hypothetical protein
VKAGSSTDRSPGMRYSSLLRLAEALAATFLATSALLCGAFTTGALAVSGPPLTLAVHPASGPTLSYFRFGVSPGHRRDAGTIQLHNGGAHSLRLMIDPVNAITASTLGSAYSLRATALRGSASWTRVGARTLMLGAHRQIDLPVSVFVPAGTAPGDYLSGISVEAVQPPSEVRIRGNVGISSLERYAVGVFVRVPGARHPLIRFTAATMAREPAGVTFFLLATNPGNVILQNVYGSVSITQGRRLVTRGPLGPGTFVSGTSLAYPVPTVREQPREGTVYRVRAALHYGHHVAYLNAHIRFGHADAVRQQQFGGPAAPAEHRSGGGWIVAAVIAAAVFVLLLLLVVLAGTRRRPLDERSAQRELERAIGAARRSGYPLSVIGITQTSPQVSGRSLAALTRRHARRSDRVWRLRRVGALVVAPDTPADAARMLASEIARHMPGGPLATTVRPVAWDGRIGPAELLAWATGASGP